MIQTVVKRNTLYEDESISNQPDLFLTDRFSQDFHSVFGHHNKTFSECQTVWYQIRPGILSGLIWVQTVRKSNQQMTQGDKVKKSCILS